MIPTVHDQQQHINRTLCTIPGMEQLHPRTPVANDDNEIIPLKRGGKDTGKPNLRHRKWRAETDEPNTPTPKKRLFNDAQRTSEDVYACQQLECNFVTSKIYNLRRHLAKHGLKANQTNEAVAEAKSSALRVPVKVTKGRRITRSEARRLSVRGFFDDLLSLKGIQQEARLEHKREQYKQAMDATSHPSDRVAAELNSFKQDQSSPFAQLGRPKNRQSLCNLDADELAADFARRCPAFYRAVLSNVKDDRRPGALFNAIAICKQMNQRISALAYFEGIANFAERCPDNIWKRQQAMGRCVSKPAITSYLDAIDAEEILDDVLKYDEQILVVPTFDNVNKEIGKTHGFNFESKTKLDRTARFLTVFKEVLTEGLNFENRKKHSQITPDHLVMHPTQPEAADLILAYFSGCVQRLLNSKRHQQAGRLSSIPHQFKKHLSSTRLPPPLPVKKPDIVCLTTLDHNCGTAKGSARVLAQIRK